MRRSIDIAGRTIISADTLSSILRLTLDDGTVLEVQPTITTTGAAFLSYTRWPAPKERA